MTTTKLRSWETGLQRGKLLSKLKVRMDAYRVNQSIFNFAASNLDASLKVREINEPESVSLLLTTVMRFEQDAHVLTMVGSFVDCSDATSSHLFEASHDEGDSRGTRQLVGMLLELKSVLGDELSVIGLAAPLLLTAT